MTSIEDVERLDYGWYLLNAGDTAQTIARSLYGDPRKYAILLHSNPIPWDEVTHIRVPNKSGRVTRIVEGDSPQRIIERLFPNQPVSIYLQPFFKWNGGQGYRLDLAVGDMVFVPER